MHEFYMGNVFDAYEFFGAHPNLDGTVFRTFAPSAERITIIGEWNDWQEENMIKDGHVWSYFSAKAKKGQMYKYVIYSSLGRVEHCDPYGFAMELRPNFASIITDLTSTNSPTVSGWKSAARTIMSLSISMRCTSALGIPTPIMKTAGIPIPTLRTSL